MDVLLKSEGIRSTTKAALLSLAEHLLRLSERSYSVLLMIRSPIISPDSSLKVECLSLVPELMPELDKAWAATAQQGGEH